jgi:hypothetical protein
MAPLRDQASEAVVHRLFQILLAPEVTFGSQNGGVPQQELNLLQFTSVDVAQFRAGPTNV